MSEKVIKQFENEMKDFQDRLRILETEMHSIGEMRQELKRLREGFAQIFAVSVSALDLDSSIRDFMLLADRASSDVVHTSLEAYLKRVKEFFETYDKSPMEKAVSEYVKRWVSLILVTASVKKVTFNDFCSSIIQNLGSDLAKKYVALEDIVKFYGAENASAWKKLIE